MRLKAIKKDVEAGEERKVLEAYADLIEQEAEANRKVKEAQKALETKVHHPVRQAQRGRDQDAGRG